MQVVRDTSPLSHEQLLAQGLALASTDGLARLSIASVAKDLRINRSEVIASFRTEEALQAAVLQAASDAFAREVIDPSQAVPAGENRLRAYFQRWLAWSRAPRLTRGCPFVQASRELDALPPAVRTQLTGVLAHWSGLLRQAAEDAKAAGELAPALDSDQIVFELHGLYLSHHFWHWAMRDPSAETRTRRALDRLLAASRAGAHSG